ncbi:MAG: SPOR domain-containing protein [Mangrovibacterium sp.]
MKFSIAGIGLILFCLNVFSQPVSSGIFSLPENMHQGIVRRISPVQNARIDSLLQNHIRQNKRMEGTEGYRLEIFFSSGSRSREEALQRKTEFLRKFPDETAYMLFLTPNFKVRVGDCRTRSEALKLKERIRKDYPNAFIVPDIIQFPELYTDKTNE